MSKVRIPLSIAADDDLPLPTAFAPPSAKVTNVVTISSVNNLQASLATAQRRVEQGQNQVQRDSEQLAQSRQQLVKQQDQLRDTERSSQQAQAENTPAIKAPQLDKAIEIATPPKPAPKPVQPVQPQAPSGQLNSIGQTIGRLIDTTA